MCPPPPRTIPVNAAQIAYVNMQECDGKAALHFAAQNENVAMIRMLIDHGADPGIRDGFGRSARDYTRESSDAHEVLMAAEIQHQITVRETHQ